MDMNFLKAHADRCRSLAENADEFTKRRLLDLAANYDKRLAAAGPSVAIRTLKVPLNVKDAPTQVWGSLPEEIACRLAAITRWKGKTIERYDHQMMAVWGGLLPVVDGTSKPRVIGDKLT